MIVGLDLASTAGVAAVSDAGELLHHGVVARPNAKTPIAATGQYPQSYWNEARHHAYLIVEQCSKLARLNGRESYKVAVEETNLTKGSRYAQKYLEFLHYAVLGRFELEFQGGSYPESISYVDTTAWRSALGIKMPKDARKNNKALKKLRDDWASTNPGAKMTPGILAGLKAAAGISGKVTMKHMSVQYANQRFGLGLKKKDDDVADAICVACAALVPGVEFCDGR